MFFFVIYKLPGNRQVRLCSSVIDSSSLPAKDYNKMLVVVNSWLEKMYKINGIENFGFFCFQQQSLVIDPLPTSVLEECTIPNYGRFTAFSSGHVRIVFNDRTSLDMWCDFSKRLECCIQHSEGIHSQQVVKKKQNLERLRMKCH